MAWNEINISIWMRNDRRASDRQIGNLCWADSLSNVNVLVQRIVSQSGLFCPLKKFGKVLEHLWFSQLEWELLLASESY